MLNKLLLKQLLKLKGIPQKGYLPPLKRVGFVEVCPFKYGRDAAVCISSDFELSWAWRFRDKELMDVMGQKDRDHVPIILNLLETYNIPITWATVGHLFLESCTRDSNGLAHSYMPRPNKFWRWDGDWYYHDPCSNYLNAPLWYAPDLIRLIMESKISHEIASHSFSHIDFSDGYCDDNLVESEIQECIEAMRPYQLKPTSFVFPFNKCTHRFNSIFNKFNINAVRIRNAKFAMSYPTRDIHGVWNIYESIGLRSSPYYKMRDRLDIYIDEAKKYNQVVHYWFHPSDDKSTILTDFKDTLAMLNRRNCTKDIWMATMSELSNYCELRNNISLSVKMKNNQTEIKCNLKNNNYCNDEISLNLHTNSKNISIFIGVDKYDLTPIDKEKIFYKDERNVIVTFPVNNYISLHRC